MDIRVSLSILDEPRHPCYKEFHDTLDTLVRLDTMAKPNRKQELLGILNRKLEEKIPSIETAVSATPASHSPPPEPPATDQSQPRRAKTATSRRPGRDQHFWLHEEDRKLIRELAGWIGVQGERPSDSRIVRAALHIARTGDDFLRAYRQISELDARLSKQDIQSG